MKNFKTLFLVAVFTLGAQGVHSNELQTFTVTLQDAPLEQVLDGTIEAVKKSTLSAEISGRITEINFDVDNPVKKGELLMRVRDNEYKARLRQAEATSNEAKANFQDAKLEFARAQDMFKKNVISESQYDRADAAVKSAEARVAASKAAVAEAREQLANTMINAPYSGVVIERHVELGETVNPGKPLMTGLSLDELRAIVDVPQTFINAIRTHKKARVIQLEDGQSILSETLTIFPFADPKRHTFRIRVNLPKGLANLYPGMLVKVAFLTDATKRLMIPNEALVQRSEVNAVYVVDAAGKVKLRQVRLGQKSANQVEILAGLDAGESIALNPVEAGILLKSQTGEIK